MVNAPPTVLAIAGNRFGLGLRPADSPLAEPAADLLAQFSRFDPRPAGIAEVPGSAEMARQFREYLVRIRPFLKANGLAMPAMTGDSPPIATAPPIDDAAIRKALRQQYQENYGGQARARIVAALTTPAPFAERLVHFWANHFAVSADKLQTLGLAGTLEFEAIRPNVGGRFIDMLLAVERHPALLLYLDQAQSIGPDSQVAAAARRRAARRQPGLNENLGREILELHTLGVDGGYSQADVQELARALSGWSIGGFVRAPIGIEAPDGAFVFQPGWHEPGDRTLLGKRYSHSGEAQARAMLADLAVHPATARHLASKLARHFVADVPPPALVDRLAEAYTSSGGDLMAVYRVLVAAPEAWAMPTPKFKSPWEWTISALRAIGATTAPDLRIVGALNDLGQPIWRSGSPAGWDDTAAAWAAPDALLRRVELAGRIAAAVGDRIDARALAPRVLPGVLGPGTTQAIARAATPQQGLALLLAAPEFLRR
jgi:uncharacterized protein (DUF1800 family)